MHSQTPSVLVESGDGNIHPTTTNSQTPQPNEKPVQSTSIPQPAFILRRGCLESVYTPSARCILPILWMDGRKRKGGKERIGKERKGKGRDRYPTAHQPATATATAIADEEEREEREKR